MILYGVSDPRARKKYLEAYGCSHWTPEALDVLRRHAPVIEIGAGLGHWQAAAAAEGVDIIAFDNHANLPVSDVRAEPKFVGKVEKADESVVRKHPK